VTKLALSEDFSSNDDMPPAPMLEAADKNFYGFGEASTILKFDPATGTRTTLHVFRGPDGSRPLDSLIQAPDGNFYGTTANGGANDPNASATTTDDIGGTLFRLTPAGVVTTLVSFDPVTGTAPRASLVQGNDGCLYGTTSAKGPNGTGTIFRVTVFPPKLIAVIPRSDQNETKLVLHGQFFSGTTTVTVNGAPVISFVVDSSTQITATVSSAQVQGTVSVTTALGSTSLNIDKAVPGSVLNLSSRLAVLPGDNALIGGFIITGSQPQKLLLRAMGPSLTKLGVTGALQDPTLALHNREGTLIASNDNWASTQIGGIITSDQSTDIRNTGLAPTDGREAALLVTLDPGVYTAIQRGSNNTEGVGVVELYDLSPASSNAGLANISTRGFITNDTVLIGGFIVGQPDSARVIVRGLGPSLGALGVRNPLPNPTIDLRDSNGAQIAFNRDWRDSQEQEIIQTTIPPNDVHEAAIVATLAPGNYTAIVRSEDNATGTALVEIYNLTR
jgi:uncharacterized repeat protein (TIGR03803 family)